MKAFERIFLYSLLAVLVFYVFLVDNKVESQVVIQEEIYARRIAIVNDEGQEVVRLSTNEYGNGVIVIYNKDGTPVVLIGDSEVGGAMFIANKSGTRAVSMVVDENGNGDILVSNKSGKVIGSLP